MPRKRSRVMPLPFSFSAISRRSETLKPYSGASCSTRWPILPYPMIARFIFLVENGRIRAAKEFLVQEFHRRLRIPSGNDETKIEQRGALRNHANIDAL